MKCRSNFILMGKIELFPEKHFIIMPNMFGNGLSSSPSNASGSFCRIVVSSVTIIDSVRAQYELVTEVFAEYQSEVGY